MSFVDSTLGLCFSVDNEFSTTAQMRGRRRDEPQFTIESSEHPPSVHPHLPLHRFRIDNDCALSSRLNSIRRSALLIPPSIVISRVLVFRRRSLRDVRRVNRIDLVRARVVRSIPIENEFLVGNFSSLSFKSESASSISAEEGMRRPFVYQALSHRDIAER